MHLIRNKCTTVYLRGKKLLTKSELHFIDIFTSFNIYFYLVMHVLLYV